MTLDVIAEVLFSTGDDDKVGLFASSSVVSADTRAKAECRKQAAIIVNKSGQPSSMVKEKQESGRERNVRVEV